jgi:phosphatidate cytidylyltransferase
MISKNLALRLIVAAIAIPVILFLVFLGGDLWLYFVLLLAAIGAYEYLTNGRIARTDPLFWVVLVGVVGAVFFAAAGSMVFGVGCLLGIFLITGMVMAVGSDPVERLFSRLTYIVWGSIYLGLLYPFVYRLRGEADWMTPAPGRWWLFFLLSSLWLGDTAAMAVGKNLGKRKLAPAVSPNKTIEGFAGGFVGVFVAAAIFKLFWLRDVAVGHFVVIAILIGLFGQLGDLVESLWKRSLGIKDSSAIIPGHGGVLDRFDSLLFTAPVLFLYLRYILFVDWL